MFRKLKLPALLLLGAALSLLSPTTALARHHDDERREHRHRFHVYVAPAPRYYVAPDPSYYVPPSWGFSVTLGPRHVAPRSRYYSRRVL